LTFGALPTYIISNLEANTSQLTFDHWREIIASLCNNWFSCVFPGVEEKEKMRKFLKDVMIFFGAPAVVILILLTNILAITSLLRNPILKASASHQFILSRAVADLLVSVLHFLIILFPKRNK